MSNTNNEKKESYAIDNDDIDIRLIQRQIANVSTQLSTSKQKTKPKDSKEDITEEEQSPSTAARNTEDSTSSKQTTILPPLLKGSTPRIQSQMSSKNDSLDVNEFMDMSNNEVSLDLLEQLTNKITSEMGTESLPSENNEEAIETEINEIEQPDESEENINRLEANEELAEEETINQENEKTIVTEQICEYPVNNFDTEYMQTLDYLEGDKRYKKYVIYIDEENIDYINSLSIQERKDIINSILREQDDIRIAKREEARRKKLVTHLLIGVISFIICVPLLYLLVNKCMEATISNYKRSQYNFEVLYKERGKIQSTQTRN